MNELYLFLFVLFRRRFDDNVAERGGRTTPGQSDIGTVAPYGLFVFEHQRRQDNHSVGFTPVQVITNEIDTVTYFNSILCAVLQLYVSQNVGIIFNLKK